MNYQQTFDSTVRDPAAFWLEQASGLDWFVPPRTGLSTDAQGVSRWFADGVLNTAHLAPDVHVTAGNGERTALIYDSPVTGARASYSYRALRDAVALCSGMLRDLGVGKGDRVLLYMPMIPEAVIAMLACARLRSEARRAGTGGR